MKYISIFGFQVFRVYMGWLCCPDMNHSLALHTMRAILLSQNWTKEDEAYDWMPRIGFLIQPNGEMTKTLSDNAVTNQSQCGSRRTVKDISGQSSHALVRRGRPVTANSHAAPCALRPHREAPCSCFFLFHPITILLFPDSLSFLLSSYRHSVPAFGGQTEGHRQCW